MHNRLTIFVASIVVITFLVLFATIIQTPQHYYDVYAQILGISSSDNNNPSVNTASETASNNTITSDFLTYKNNQYGYTIRYPSNWTIHESPTSSSDSTPGVYFPSVNIWSSSDGYTASSLSVTVKDASQFLDSNDIQVKSKTPHDYVLDKINDFATSTIGEKYVKDKPVTLINNTTTAWELDYTYPSISFRLGGEGGGGKTVYNIEYFMTKDSRLYVFSF